MKNKIIIIAFFALLLGSCQENERLTYSDKGGVYFNIAENNDSIMYSFTMTDYEADADTLRLVVRLLGKTEAYDRKFKVVVNEESTAIEGTHFRKLEEYYTLPSRRTSVVVPLYVLKTKDLEEEVKLIDISLVEGGDFVVGYKNKSRIRYFVTNQIVKPSYWDSPLALYFGEYSKVKHQICIDLRGHDFPLVWNASNSQYYMRMGRKASLYFALNEVYDDDNRLIETWDPF